MGKRRNEEDLLSIAVRETLGDLIYFTDFELIEEDDQQVPTRKNCDSGIAVPLQGDQHLKQKSQGNRTNKGRRSSKTVKKTATMSISPPTADTENCQETIPDDKKTISRRSSKRAKSEVTISPAPLRRSNRKSKPRNFYSEY